MKIITLTMKEQSRAAILSKLAQSGTRKGKLTMAMLANSLGLSERQAYRLKARFRQAGVWGLAHGNRGRPSGRKMSRKHEDRIVRLAVTTYQGFNDHHLTEKLQEAGLVVARRKVSAL